MRALPARYYGDPAEVVDELRELRRLAEKKLQQRDARQRLNKRRRIQALVKQTIERASDES